MNVPEGEKEEVGGGKAKKDGLFPGVCNRAFARDLRVRELECRMGVECSLVGVILGVAAVFVTWVSMDTVVMASGVRVTVSSRGMWVNIAGLGAKSALGFGDASEGTSEGGFLAIFAKISRAIGVKEADSSSW